MPLVATLRDGRVIASGQRTQILLLGGDHIFRVTIPDLKMIEYVIQYKFTADPPTDPGTVINEEISGNMVSFILVGVGSGTTLTAEAVAIGV